MIDRKVFFDLVRKAPFPNRLTAGQVAGMETILEEWEKRPLTDLRWLAYMLATAYIETRTMQPIPEIGKGKGRSYGKPAGPYSQVYYGRGLVQLTWLENYQKAAKAVGVDLVRYPDRALEPAIAAQIMFRGMQEGWFAGDKSGRHTLGRYFNTKTDWTGARRIINGTDKASTVAGYAKDFHAALTAAYREEAPPPPKPTRAENAPVRPQPDDPGPTGTPAQDSWLVRLIRAIFVR